MKNKKIFYVYETVNGQVCPTPNKYECTKEWLLEDLCQTYGVKSELELLEEGVKIVESDN